ncbi:MAG TPA: hypothetical protein VLQ80_08055 [Candidatus Saccharimonadia bacterium]|nr:hypothetical protein [Candidatus Saccharimonadia bacterium]
MAKTIDVKAGDSLVGLAYEHLFSDWQTIYNHPENVKLRAAGQQSTDPNQLYVGDQVYLPDKTPRTVQIQAFGPEDDRATKQYTFVVQSAKFSLSLFLEDDHGQPYAYKRYKLRVLDKDNVELVGKGKDASGREIDLYAGITNEFGQVVKAIAPRAQRCEITLWPDNDNQNEERKWTVMLTGAIPRPA